MVSKEEEDPGLLWCVFYLLGSWVLSLNIRPTMMTHLSTKTAITYHNYFETLSDICIEIYLFCYGYHLGRSMPIRSTLIDSQKRLYV